jgi:ribosomal-protein-alanine N-acetyltransferase
VSEAGPIAAPPPAAPRRLETARLLLTAPEPADGEEIATLLGDPRMGRWLGGTLARDAALLALDRWSAHWAAHGFGLWIARDRSTGELLGRGGLWMTVVAGAAEVEVGWAITPQRWGQGLATELGAAALTVAEEDLAIDSVVAFTLHDNAASRCVMQKLGLHHDRDIDHRALPHVLYRR